MTRRTRVLAAIIVLAIVALSSGAPAVRLRERALAADPPPANDNFASAEVITAGAGAPWADTRTTAGATLQPGETAPCGAIGATVWYAFTPGGPNTFDVSTAGSDFDAVLAVYNEGAEWYPSPPGGNLKSLGCSASGQASSVTFSADRGRLYYIQAGGRNGATGNLTLTVRCVEPCRPDNDNYQNLMEAHVGATEPRQTLTVSTANATLEPGEPRPCGNIGATVWFHLWTESTAKISIDTVGSDFHTVLAIYGPNPAIFPSPPGGLSAADCTDAPGSRLALDAQAFSSYWFQVGGANAATGQLTLNLACDPACPPLNDDINQAPDPILPLDEISHTEAATTEPSESRPCGNVGRTIWYEIVLAGDGNVAVDTAGSSFETVVAAYTRDVVDGNRVPVRNVGCSAGASATPARLEFVASASTPYLIQVGGLNGAAGELHVSVTCEPASCPPQNDAMQNPGLLYSGLNEVVDTSGATVEAGEPRGCGDVSATVWYIIPASQGGRMRVSAADSDYPTVAAVYRFQFNGPSVSGLALLGCGTPDQPSIVDFDMAPDANYGDYVVQIGSLSGRGGTLRLRADCIRSCATLDQPTPAQRPASSDAGVANSTGGGIITLPNTGSGGYLPGAR